LTQEADVDDAVRNEALLISLEWGPRRSIPFEERLAAARPELSGEEVADLRKLTNQVESEAWGTVASFFTAHGMKDRDANAAWTRALLAKWPWLTEKSLAALWTQGCYYAWKDGELT
jgi:hypothetical protein